MRSAPAAKEAGKFPVVENVTKLVPVAKWRENSRFVLFVRQATILIGSGEKKLAELIYVQEIHCLQKSGISSFG